MDVANSDYRTPLPSFRDWISAGRLAPFLEAVKSAGSAGSLLRCNQPAGDVSDPATSDVVLVANTGPNLRADIDWGTGRFRADMHTGGLALQPSLTANHIEVDRPHQLMFLALPVAYVSELLAEERGGQGTVNFGVLHSETFINPVIASLLPRLWEVSASGRPSSRLYGDSAVIVIVQELALQAKMRTSPQPRQALSPVQLRKVQAYIEDHLAQDTGLQELADLIGLSRFHFCRAFKASTGMAPHQWRQSRRLERAKVLLASTSDAVSDIAAQVGYDDPSHLAALFRKWLGATPVAYRRSRQD